MGSPEMGISSHHTKNNPLFLQVLHSFSVSYLNFGIILRPNRSVGLTALIPTSRSTTNDSSKWGYFGLTTLKSWKSFVGIRRNPACFLQYAEQRVNKWNPTTIGVLILQVFCELWRSAVEDHVPSWHWVSGPNMHLDTSNWPFLFFLALLSKLTMTKYKG